MSYKGCYKGKMKDKRFVELGGGLKPTKNGLYYNIDYMDAPTVDLVHDLNEGIPLEDDSVSLLYTAHCIEHLNDFIHIMSEIHRVLKKGGTAIIKVPYATWGMTPLHKMLFLYSGFNLFIKDEEDVSSEKLNVPQFNLLHKRIVFNIDGLRLMKPIAKFFQVFVDNKPKLYDAYFRNIFTANELHVILSK